MAKIYVEVKVSPEWEQTQEELRREISKALGYEVVVGDDGYVWTESGNWGTPSYQQNEIGSIGWKSSTNMDDDPDICYFEMEA